MYFGTRSVLALLGVVARAAPASTPEVVTSSTERLLAANLPSNSWLMNTWTGTSCQGTQLWWSVPDGYTCTNLESVTSLRVTTFGGCSTNYYSGSGRQGSPQHVDFQGDCYGYAQGDRIRSFSVQC